MIEPTQTPNVVEDVIAAGLGLTVTGVVTKHVVVGSVYVIVGKPADTPVTTPPEVTVA